MKLAISVILALVCTLAVADSKGKVCETGKDTAASYWDGTKCTACPTGCSECVWKNNAVSCINCGTAAGKFLNVVSDVGSCGNCIANCADCKGPNAADCIAPAVGYKVAPSGIFKCSTDPGCLYCNSDEKCSKCQYGFRFDSTSEKCVACNAGPCADCTDSITTCKKCQYMHMLKNVTCVDCAAGCTSCPCTACSPKFAFQNATCVQCPENCDVCDGTGTCTTCTKLFFLETDKKTCTHCPKTCVDCGSDGLCTACPSGTFMSADKKSCTPCAVANCDACDSTGICTTCSKSYFPSSDKKACTHCPNNCVDCGSDGLCTACPSGTFMSADKKSCTKCVDNCDVCKDNTTCTTCKATYLANGTGGCATPWGCSIGQSLDGNGLCKDGTIDNCVFGNNVDSSCMLCAIGYYINGKICTPCPAGCRACTTSNGVLKCDTLAEVQFSTVTANGKADITGYAPGNVAHTTLNIPDKCMPNNLIALPIQNMTNKQCNAYDSCPYPSKMGADWTCYFDGKGNNAIKVTASLFATVVVAIFAL